MITTIREYRIEVEKPTMSQSFWRAVVRGGEVTKLDELGCFCSKETLIAYSQFLKEIIEAIKNAAP